MCPFYSTSRLVIEQLLFSLCIFIYWREGLSMQQAMLVAAMSVGSTLVSWPIMICTRLPLTPDREKDGLAEDALGRIFELLPSDITIAGAAYTSIMAYALAFSYVVLPLGTPVNPFSDRASTSTWLSQGLPCKYLLLFLASHATIKVCKLAIFGKAARPRTARRKMIITERIVHYDAHVERLASQGDETTPKTQHEGDSGSSGTLQLGERSPSMGGFKDGDSLKPRQMRVGSGLASPSESSLAGNSSTGNSRGASAENLMNLIHRDLAREIRERERHQENENESEHMMCSSGGSGSGRSLMGVPTSTTQSHSSQKGGFGSLRLSSRKGRPLKLASPSTPEQVQQMLSSSSLIAGCSQLTAHRTPHNHHLTHSPLNHTLELHPVLFLHLARVTVLTSL